MCKDCPICIEPLFPNTLNILRLKKKVLVKKGEKLNITKLKCGHVYHNRCIKNWFINIEVKSSNQCPMCRENIIFKPNSKDLMMRKIRFNDKNYTYGDEYLNTIIDISIPTYTFSFPTVNNNSSITEIEREFIEFVNFLEYSDYNF